MPGGQGRMIMIGGVVLLVCCTMMSSMAVVVAKPDIFSDSTATTTTGEATVPTTTSSVYGSGTGGNAEFGMMCPDTRYVKNIEVNTRDVGPHVVNNRLARIDSMQLTCNQGTKRRSHDGKTYGGGSTCPGGVSGFNIWSTDVIQRLQAICKDGSFGLAKGTPTGTKSTFTCPEGSRLTGIKGFKNEEHDIYNMRFTCGA